LVSTSRFCVPFNFDIYSRCCGYSWIEGTNLLKHLQDQPVYHSNNFLVERRNEHLGNMFVKVTFMKQDFIEVIPHNNLKFILGSVDRTTNL